GSSQSRPVARSRTTTERSTAGGIALRLTGSGGSSRSFRASLAGPGLELSGQESVSHSQLPDLCMQRPHRVLVDLGFLLPAALEDVSRALQKSLLPLMDHRRMHAIFGGQFRHRALALQGFQRHTGFEPRVMVPALLHVPISSFLETSRRQIVASVTVRFSGSISLNLAIRWGLS